MDVPPKRRVALHMAAATLPRPKRGHARFWHFVAIAYLMPAGAAIAVIAALKLLMWGLR